MPDFPTVHCTKFPRCPSLLPCRKFPRYFPGTPSLSSRNVPRGFAGHFPPIGFWESPPLLPSLFCSRKFPLHAPTKCHLLTKHFPPLLSKNFTNFPKIFCLFCFCFQKDIFYFYFFKEMSLLLPSTFSALLPRRHPMWFSISSRNSHCVFEEMPLLAPPLLSRHTTHCFLQNSC